MSLSCYGALEIVGLLLLLLLTDTPHYGNIGNYSLHLVHVKWPKTEISATQLVHAAQEGYYIASQDLMRQKTQW